MAVCRTTPDGFCWKVVLCISSRRDPFVLDHSRADRLLGEIEARESANDVTFKNAIDLLERLRIVERDAKGAEKEVFYLRGEAFDELPALRDRLASALVAR